MEKHPARSTAVSAMWLQPERALSIPTTQTPDQPWLHSLISMHPPLYQKLCNLLCGFSFPEQVELDPRPESLMTNLPCCSHAGKESRDLPSRSLGRLTDRYNWVGRYGGAHKIHLPACPRNGVGLSSSSDMLIAYHWHPDLAWSFYVFPSKKAENMPPLSWAKLKSQLEEGTGKTGSIFSICREPETESKIADWNTRKAMGLSMVVLSLHRAFCFELLRCQADPWLATVALWAAEISQPDEIPHILSQIKESWGEAETFFHVCQLIQAKGRITTRRMLHLFLKQHGKTRRSTW